MLNSLLFASALFQTQAPLPTAGGLVSKMFERYTAAASLAGTVRTTQTAGSTSLVTDTNIAYERPSKLIVDQRQKRTTGPKNKLIISDGTNFLYSRPERLFGPPLLKELVKPEGKDAQTIGDLYIVVATELPDRSPVLDALIARREDLRYFMNQLAGYRLTGKATIDGRTANVIEGDWRESEQVAPSGKYRLYLTDEGDLVRYELTMSFAPPVEATPGSHPVTGDNRITVTTTWDASIVVNGPVKAGTFVLRAP